MSIFRNDQGWQYALGTLFLEIVFCLALILLVRALFGRLLGPVGCRLLWGVLIVRCLIPVSIPSLYHPVTHLINAYEQRRENPPEDRAVSPKPPQIDAVEINTAEIGAATVMERLFDGVTVNESDAAVVVNEPIEMSMYEQSGGGHGETALPVATPLEIGFGVNPDAAVDADANALSSNLELQEGRAVSPRPMQADLIVEQTLPVQFDHPEPVGTSQAATPKRINIGTILFGVWAAGAVAFLATAIMCNRRMVRAACQSPETVPDWMQAMFLECRKQLKIHIWPVLIVSRSVKTPCLVGAIRPRVLVPQQLLDEENSLRTSSPSQGGEKSKIDPRAAMRHVFLHELTHLKQGDIWLSWCWTLVMALHWYNPLLWWAGRLVGFDCEAACDHRVLEQLEPSRHTSYGRSLLEILQKLNSPVVRSPGFSAVIEGKTNFERRLVMITNYRKRTWKQTLAAGVMLTLLLAASLTTFAREKHEPISADKAKMIGYIEDFFLHNYRDITMRKSLEWGDVVTDDQGNSTIRYKFEALIWDKDRMIMCEDFTFDKDGRYVSSEKVDGYPQEKEAADTAKSDVSPEAVEESQKLTQEGWRLFTLGNAVEAEKKFEAAIKSNPDNAIAYQGLGWVQINSGKQDEAKKTFEQCLALDPKNAAALNGLGQIAYFNDDDEEAAIGYWEKAISVFKQSTGPMLGLAQLYSLRGEYENAAKYYKMLLKYEPQNEEAKKGLQEAQAKLGNNAAATANEEDSAAYEKLVKLQEELHQAKQQLLKLDKEAFALDQAWDQERKELNQKLESMEKSEQEKLMGEFQKRHAEGSWEMTRKRTVIIQQIQEIELQLEHEKAVMQLKRDFGPGSGSRRQNEPVLMPQTPAAAKKSDADREKAAEDFLDLVSAEKYDEACPLMTPLMQYAMPVEKLQQLFGGIMQTMGKAEEIKDSRIVDEQGFRVTYATVTLEKANLTLKIAVDDEAKIAGFYIVGVLPRLGKTEAQSDEQNEKTETLESSSLSN